MNLSRLKDAALEKAVVAFLGRQFRRYGTIQSFNLNTSSRIFSARVLLHGEPEPLTISEAHYRIDRNGENATLVLYDVHVSRAWAQHLLEDRFPEVPLKLPAFLLPLIA